jgi:uncharacterized protein (TIGR02246 family)
MAATDEEAIFQEIDNFNEVWNKGDATLAASFFTEDGVRVGAMGDIEHGREEIAQAYDHLLHTAMPGAKVSIEKGTVRMLSPDFAIWQGGIKIEKPNSGGSPAMKGHVVQVMQKVQGRWLIVEAHPKLFPPAP